MKDNRPVNKTRYTRPELPELKLWTMDMLGTLADDDLYSLLLRLEEERNRVDRNGFSDHEVKRWETELNYVSRELDIRQGRRKAHAEWLSAMGAVGYENSAN
jgi:hypothetical protein